MQATIRRYYSKLEQQERRPVDWVFVGIVVVLNVIGLIMAYSTTFFWSYAESGNTFAIFGRQLMFAGLGLVGLLVAAWMDYGYLRRIAVPMLGMMLLLLIAVLLFGDVVFGARRSLAKGSVQPSEIAKIVVIIYAAAWLASRLRQVSSFLDGLLPFGVIIGIVSGLIAVQPDLSTTVVVVVVAMTMFFMANATLPQIATVLGITGVALFVFVSLFPHALERIEVFQQTFRDPAGQTVDYHIRQLALTLGGAGLFGHGIGASYQKFTILPTPHTDSVLAVLADEMGLLGLLFTFALFGMFAWRGFLIAQRATSPFGAFIAIGITIWVTLQTLMNTLSVLAIIPFTGVPVPFLSVGGSSLVALLFACGLMISVSRGSVVDKRVDAADEDEAENRQQTWSRRMRHHGAQALNQTAAIGRRNSRARVARTHSVAGAAAHGSGGIKLDAARGIIARLRGKKQRRGPVRWRE